jgi:hypothetical protein
MKSIRGQTLFTRQPDPRVVVGCQASYITQLGPCHLACSTTNEFA